MKKSPKRKKLIAVSFKLSTRDLTVLQTKAKEFADGNLSAWLRLAGENFEPTRAQLKLLPKRRVAKRAVDEDEDFF